MVVTLCAPRESARQYAQRDGENPLGASTRPVPFMQRPCV